MTQFADRQAVKQEIEWALQRFTRRLSETGIIPPADHGSLGGLGDDDHLQYLLASDAGGRAAFTANWTDLTDGGDTALHIHDSRYYRESEVDALIGALPTTYLGLTDTPGSFTARAIPFTNAGATALLHSADLGFTQSGGNSYFDIHSPGTGTEAAGIRCQTSQAANDGDVMAFAIADAEIYLSALDVSSLTTFELFGWHYLTGICEWYNVNFTDVGTINGVTIAAHAARHESGGADAVNHDLLTGFVADEHVAHSGVSITGGTSLAGGGDITASRTLTLVNDSASPGNSFYYGTDGGGVKGFFALPAVTAASAFGTDNLLLRSDGTGRGAQGSAVSLTDAGAMSGLTDLAMSGILTFDSNVTMERTAAGVLTITRSGATDFTELKLDLVHPSSVAGVHFKSSRHAAEYWLGFGNTTDTSLRLLSGATGSTLEWSLYPAAYYFNNGTSGIRIPRLIKKTSDEDTLFGFTATANEFIVEAGGTRQFTANATQAILGSSGGEFGFLGSAVAQDIGWSTSVAHGVRHAVNTGMTLAQTIECLQTLVDSMLGHNFIGA